MMTPMTVRTVLKGGWCMLTTVHDDEVACTFYFSRPQSRRSMEKLSTFVYVLQLVHRET